MKWKVSISKSYISFEYIFNESEDACKFVETVVSAYVSDEEPVEVSITPVCNDDDQEVKANETV